MSALPSVYWPWALPVADLIDSPLDSFYLWTSTDHDAGPGGIELWSAPAPMGPWTSRGVVYTDTTAGTQTETPSVVWNELTSQFHLYYQQIGTPGAVDQATLLATSPDGVTWTRVGLAVFLPDNVNQPGDGHCGYLQPMRLGRRWLGYHLKGGGDHPHFGISYSDDGMSWVHDPRPLGYGADWFALTGNRRIEWNSCQVLLWRGQRVIVGLVSNFASGGVTNRRIFVAPVSEDLRRLTAPPTIVLPPTGQESDNYRATSLLSHDGTLYLYYQTDQNIFLAEAS